MIAQSTHAAMKRIDYIYSTLVVVIEPVIFQFVNTSLPWCIKCGCNCGGRIIIWQPLLQWDHTVSLITAVVVQKQRMTHPNLVAVVIKLYIKLKRQLSPFYENHATTTCCVVIPIILILQWKKTYTGKEISRQNNCRVK